MLCPSVLLHLNFRLGISAQSRIHISRKRTIESSLSLSLFSILYISPRNFAECYGIHLREKADGALDMPSTNRSSSPRFLHFICCKVKKNVMLSKFSSFFFLISKQAGSWCCLLKEGTPANIVPESCLIWSLSCTICPYKYWSIKQMNTYLCLGTSSRTSYLFTNRPKMADFRSAYRLFSNLQVGRESERL